MSILFLGTYTKNMLLWYSSSSSSFALSELSHHWFSQCLVISSTSPLDKMDDSFKRIFLNENVRISIQFSLKFVPKGQVDNKSTLVQVMACRLFGAKPLPEPMLSQFSDTYVTLEGDELTQWGLLIHNYICASGNWVIIDSCIGLSPVLMWSHYLNKHWLIVNRICRPKLQWNFNQNMKFSFKKIMYF